MTLRIIGAVAQGEVTCRFIEGDMPKDLVPMQDCDKVGRPIIGHSESGHHHVLERATKVMEDPNPPAGMRILWALLEEDTAIIQDAPGRPHEAQTLPAGLCQFKIAREHDPFTSQARMVAD